MKSATITPSDIATAGVNLNRPECVLATAEQVILASDWRGGVSIIWPDGTQRLVRAKGLNFALKPNGIGLLPDGSFLIAHLGEKQGGLFNLWPDGTCLQLLTELDGKPLPPCNYPHIDFMGRIWLTVSTRHVPRANAYRRDISDGFIILIDSSGARIVADNIGYTNECSVHPDGRRLFVNETFARKLSSYDILENGDLTNKKTIVEFSGGTYPDGLVFDEQGGAWITSIISNRVIRCVEGEKPQTIVEDVSPAHLAAVEQAYQSHSLGRQHLDHADSEMLKNISSLAFGGSDRRTIYLGNLLDNKIYRFRSRIKGHAPPYWKHTIKIPAQF